MYLEYNQRNLVFIPFGQSYFEYRKSIKQGSQLAVLLDRHISNWAGNGQSSPPDRIFRVNSRIFKLTNEEEVEKVCVHSPLYCPGNLGNCDYTIHL